MTQTWLSFADLERRITGGDIVDGHRRGLRALPLPRLTRRPSPTPSTR
jgi:hypothetical protein